jgi:hypothetical protein
VSSFVLIPTSGVGVNNENGDLGRLALGGTLQASEAFRLVSLIGVDRISSADVPWKHACKFGWLKSLPKNVRARMKAALIAVKPQLRWASHVKLREGNEHVSQEKQAAPVSRTGYSVPRCSDRLEFAE